MGERAVGDVQRYDCETEQVGKDWNFYEQGVMEPWPTGDWVKYEDYEAAESRCKGLEAALKEIAEPESDDPLSWQDPAEWADWARSRARTALEKGPTE
jgi:hypothetical protein